MKKKVYYLPEVDIVKEPDVIEEFFNFFSNISNEKKKNKPKSLTKTK
jgi:hypothetical protein